MADIPTLAILTTVFGLTSLIFGIIIILLILDRNYVATTGHKLYSVVKDTHDLFFVKQR